MVVRQMLGCRRLPMSLTVPTTRAYYLVATAGVLRNAVGQNIFRYFLDIIGDVYCGKPL